VFNERLPQPIDEIMHKGKAVVSVFLRVLHRKAGLPEYLDYLGRAV